MKNLGIRRLQKLAWHQKEQISSLKTVVANLKENNMIIEQQEHLLMQQFGDKMIIERLFKKTQGETMAKKFDQTVRLLQ